MVKSTLKNQLSAIFLAGTFLCAFNSEAQNNTQKDPVLMTIGNKNIPKSEFENIYYKNNNKETIDEKSAEEYLELFINFKLKVLEAEELGYDTTAAFTSELKGYRRQLSQPYLTDNDVTEALIREAYDRMKTDVKASHILLKLDENALPKDTLEIYNRALKIRERIVKGEDFAKVAKTSSEDPSAAENGGDLGYFTALQMVYPFESAVYNSKIGEVSMPVRTRFGYHLIKVFDKREARGQVRAAHIMVKLNPNASEQEIATAKTKIEEIYGKLNSGSDFTELAQNFSDDRGSGKKGGELPWFGTGRMVPEFEDAAFNLKNNGDVSQPVLSRFGWHIIKRLEKKDLAAFEELKAEIKTRISKDSRSQKSRSALVDRIKKEYRFAENKKKKTFFRKENFNSLADFYTILDSSYFKGNWKAEKAKSLNQALFTLGDKSFSQQDFAAFLESRQSSQAKVPAELLVQKMYSAFVNENCISYEESRLDQKYPEFRALMQEYRDGILLFELTDKKVWSKAVKDTTGLDAYYAANKDKFMWEERADAKVYICANEAVAKKTRELLKSSKSSLSDEEILKKINTDSQLNLRIESGLYTRNDNEWVDKVDWKPGLSESVAKENQVVFVNISKKLSPEPKTLKEARGLVTAEYQAFLEKQWIDALRAKYEVKVNREVFSTIK